VLNAIAASSRHYALILEHPGAVLFKLLFPVLLGSGAFAIFMNLVARTLPNRAPRHLITYFLVLAVGATIGATVKYLLLIAVDVVSAEENEILALQAARNWVWAVVLLGIAGVTVRSLSVQTDIAERALAASLEQQSLILINEENSRRQIALLLHDRVQAGLMTACLELRLATTPGADVDRARIETVIAKLDGIRGLDVRQAARELSPDLVNIDLHTAVLELARRYEPGMNTEIHISPQITSPKVLISTDVLLACYRITEQGLLNAVVHGHSTQAIVTLELVDEREVILEVMDNGRLVSSGEAIAGFGSAIIESWCRVLGGTWELEYASGEGARLSARFPIGSHSGIHVAEALSSRPA
jgi:signal transduction histidine kinase